MRLTAIPLDIVNGRNVFNSFPYGLLQGFKVSGTAKAGTSYYPHYLGHTGTYRAIQKIKASQEPRLTETKPLAFFLFSMTGREETSVHLFATVAGEQGW